MDVSILVIEFDNLIFYTSEFLNVYYPIVYTESGIYTSVSYDCSNARSYIVITESGIIILVTSELYNV